jgi:DNA-binding MarR family transcriptional regulator
MVYRILFCIRSYARQGSNYQREVSRLINVEHRDAILRTFILFVQTAHAVLKYGDAYFYRKARLSVTKFIVLQTLAINGTMTLSEIAGWTHKERHNITTLVERLKKDGLVTTQRGSRDKRFVNVMLTDKGREVVSKATPVARDIVDQVMASISEGHAVLLEKPLIVLRQNAYDGLEHLVKRAQHRPG